MPGESQDRCISGPERNMPRNRSCPLGLRVLAPFPHPARVYASYSCAGFCNLTRLCPTVSVHLVVGRNKNHLDFFPDWMIRMYYFLFRTLLLFPSLFLSPPPPLPTSPPPTLVSGPDWVGLSF